jgi:hypothetical protein
MLTGNAGNSSSSSSSSSKTAALTLPRRLPEHAANPSAALQSSSAARANDDTTQAPLLLLLLLLLLLPVVLSLLEQPLQLQVAASCSSDRALLECIRAASSCCGAMGSHFSASAAAHTIRKVDVSAVSPVTEALAAAAEAEE